jgi:uncharacterized protein (DUF488 family)
MEIYTIGFTQKNARQFFDALIQAKIEQLLDIRLNNVSQLAGFTKKADLDYFLSKICNAAYIHETRLAPTSDMLDEYKKGGGAWDEYERAFLALMESRRVEEAIPRSLFAKRTVLLCSEATPEHCHRRLVAEYLKSKWGNVTIRHL